MAFLEEPPSREISENSSNSRPNRIEIICKTSREVFDICNGVWTVGPSLLSRLHDLNSVTDRDKKIALVLAHIGR